MNRTRRVIKYLGYTLEAGKTKDGRWLVRVSAQPHMPPHWIGALAPTKRMRDAHLETKAFMRKHPKWYPRLTPIDTGALRRSITCNIS